MYEGVLWGIFRDIHSVSCADVSGLLHWLLTGVLGSTGGLFEIVGPKGYGVKHNGREFAGCHNVYSLGCLKVSAFWGIYK